VSEDIPQSVRERAESVRDGFVGSIDDTVIRSVVSQCVLLSDEVRDSEIGEPRLRLSGRDAEPDGSDPGEGKLANAVPGADDERLQSALQERCGDDADDDRDRLERIRDGQEEPQ